MPLPAARPGLLFALLLAAYLVALFWGPLQALPAHAPLNYNEGWNAFHAQRLVEGGPLYPPVSPAVFINYPPLSFYVVGTLGRLTGDDIIAGRLLATASLFVVAFDVGLIAIALGAGRLFGAMSGLLLLAIVALVFPDYLVTDDPEWPGHALQATALVLLVRRDQVTAGRLAVAVLLLAAGGLAKQSLVFAPLAITLWLLQTDRAALCRWLAAWLGVLVVATAGLLLAYGQGFVAQVLQSARSYSPQAPLPAALHVLPWLLPFILAAIYGLCGSRRPGGRLMAWYLGSAGIGGLLMLGVDGIGYNALFDLLIAMAAGCGLAMQHGARSARTPAWRRLLLGLYLLPFLGSLPLVLTLDEAFIARARDPGWPQAIAAIAAAPGEVACESLALCYWAGRPSAFEFFNYGQSIRRRPAQAAALAQAFTARRFALVQLDSPAGSFRLPAPVNAALAAAYEPTRTTPVALLVPKS